MQFVEFFYYVLHRTFESTKNLKVIDLPVFVCPPKSIFDIDIVNVLINKRLFGNYVYPIYVYFTHLITLFVHQDVYLMPCFSGEPQAPHLRSRVPALAIFLCKMRSPGADGLKYLSRGCCNQITFIRGVALMYVFIATMHQIRAGIISAIRKQRR